MNARLRPVPRGVRQAVLDTATIRDFSGGWNVVDSQLNMKTKFQPVLDNIRRLEDGSLGIRQGTTLFVDEDDFLAADPEIVKIPQGQGTIIGNATGEANAFDGVQNPVAGSCASGSGGFEIGKDFGGTHNLLGAEVYPSNLGRFIDHNNAGTVVLTLEASVDNVVWEELDTTGPISSHGVPLDGVTLRVSGAPNKDQITLQPYQYARVVINQTSSPTRTCIIGEIEFYETTIGDPIEEEGYIVEIEYFQDNLIVFFSSGKIYSADASGTVTIIWSDAIAGLLPGTPSGWSHDVDFVSTTKFGGELIACNGVDKPLLIDLNAATKVTYLQDLASGSNANVPIARYVIAMNDYVLMAGDPVHPARVHISNSGTSGTWVGDADPNDAVFKDLDKVVPANEPVIRGLARFRTQAVVAFEDASVVGTLGIYDDTGNHTPDFSDVIVGHGTISHRSMIDLGNDLLMCDNVGIPSLKRGVFTAVAEPDRVSDLVDPEIQRNLGHLTPSTTTKHIFGVYNKLEKQYMIFIPDHDPPATETPVDHGTDPLTVVKPGTGRLYLSFPKHHHFFIGGQVDVSGAIAFNNFTADQLNGRHTIISIPDYPGQDVIEIDIAGVESSSDPDEQIGGGASVQSQAILTHTIGYTYDVVDTLKITAWSRARGWFWTCGTVTALGRVILSDGRNIYVLGSKDFETSADFIDTAYAREIEWAWETPWVDFDKRMDTKQSKYIGLDTIGYAQFTASMFTDQIYRNSEGFLTPQLQMQFSGGSTGGYGQGQQPYGGGRRTSTERLYGWPCKFKIAKFRFEGSSREPLRFASLSLAYARGSIRR